jgi:hypothetical protein
MPLFLFYLGWMRLEVGLKGGLHFLMFWIDWDLEGQVSIWGDSQCPPQRDSNLCPAHQWL